MAGPSTRRALRRRVLSTANWLEHWGERLQDEMKKQGIELVTQRDNMGDLRGDNNMPFTLRRGVARQLIEGMYEHTEEIRRFAD